MMRRPPVAALVDEVTREMTVDVGGRARQLTLLAPADSLARFPAGACRAAPRSRARSRLGEGSSASAGLRGRARARARLRPRRGGRRGRGRGRARRHVLRRRPRACALARGRARRPARRRRDARRRTRTRCASTGRTRRRAGGGLRPRDWRGPAAGHPARPRRSRGCSATCCRRRRPAATRPAARALIADPRHGRKGEGAPLRAAVEREGLFVASSSLDSDVELLEISRDDAVGSSE